MRPNPCGDVGPVFVVVSQVGQVAECIAGKDVPRALVKALTYALLHIDCLCLAVHWSQQTSPRAVDLHVLVAAIVVCYVVAVEVACLFGGPSTSLDSADVVVVDRIGLPERWVHIAPGEVMLQMCSQSLEWPACVLQTFC